MDKMYTEIAPGTKIYQKNDGTFLADAQQPKPLNPNSYNPCDNTRYKNVVLGKNNMAQMLRYNSDKGYVKSFEFDESNLQLPQLYNSREECCGCSACYAVCPVKKRLPNNGAGYMHLVISEDDSKVELQYELPHGAIYMEKDQEGFLYPVVDALLCVRCYKCIDVCPIKNSDKMNGIEFEAWGSRKEKLNNT